MRVLMLKEMFKPTGVSHETLRRMVKKGQVKCITLPSGHKRYTEAERDRVLAEMGLNQEQK